MADTEKPKSGPPESPTTARELDFDDDDAPTPPKVDKTSHAEEAAQAPRADTGDSAPAQPARPPSAQEQNVQTLKEAFPAIDVSVVKAVLVASGGQLEPAFNALLSMSDPDAQQESLPPPQPSRPVQAPASNAPRNQLESDELYARQLAEHYQNQAARREPRDSSREYRSQDPRVEKPRREMGLKPNELYDDREHNDLPVIRENIRKGFLETQTKVNSFITNLKKKIDGEDEDDEHPPVPPPRPGTQGYGMRRSGEAARRSADRERYDADPEILGDDFTQIHMHDENTPQRRSPRPQANPNLFKPTPLAPGSERKVSFQEGWPEVIDDSRQNALDPTKRPPSTSNKGKWQPLASVDPHPVAEHDPFSLGDSDDEEPKRKDGAVEEVKPSANSSAKDETATELNKPAEPPSDDSAHSKEAGDKTT